MSKKPPEEYDNCVTSEYEGHTLDIYRVEVNPNREFAYEFELYVDDEYLINATELEKKGFDYPWTAALKEWARKQIDSGNL